MKNRTIAAAALALIVFEIGLAQIRYEDSPAAAEQGLRVYRIHCARCHDLNAQGYRGRDLTQPSKRAVTDAQLANLVTQGIPGTEMPGTKLESSDLSRLISYLRSLHGPA